MPLKIGYDTAGPTLPGEYCGHGEYDRGGGRGEGADAGRRVQVAGVEHEDPGELFSGCGVNVTTVHVEYTGRKEGLVECNDDSTE